VPRVIIPVLARMLKESIVYLGIMLSVVVMASMVLILPSLCQGILLICVSVFTEILLGVSE
jgi:uncharacterized protein involved in cysteine biosynthesis